MLVLFQFPFCYIWFILYCFILLISVYEYDDLFNMSFSFFLPFYSSHFSSQCREQTKAYIFNLRPLLLWQNPQSLNSADSCFPLSTTFVSHQMCLPPIGATFLLPFIQSHQSQVPIPSDAANPGLSVPAMPEWPSSVQPLYLNIKEQSISLLGSLILISVLIKRLLPFQLTCTIKNSYEQGK